MTKGLRAWQTEGSLSSLCQYQVYVIFCFYKENFDRCLHSAKHCCKLLKYVQTDFAAKFVPGGIYFGSPNFV